MHIRSLKLTNFRNFKKGVFGFGKKNFIIGPNGSGKTNLLESLCLMSSLKSHRSAFDKHLINFESGVARVEVRAKQGKELLSLEIVLNKDTTTNRITKLNGLSLPLSEFIGKLKVVFFGSEELMMILGAPSFRRRTLDVLLSSVDSGYFLNLVEYQKVIKNRNRLLEDIGKGRAHRDELVYWNDRIAETGYYIIKKRARLISYLNKNTTSLYQKVSKDKNKILLKYKKSLMLKSSEGRKGYLKRILEKEERDIRFGSTLFGPHRDDLRIYLSGKEAKIVASRGEVRTIVLALKVVSAAFIKKTTGILPIMLLDDLFSELDKERTNGVLKILKKSQIFISSTFLPKKIKEGKNVKTVKLGRSGVTKVTN